MKCLHCGYCCLGYDVMIVDNPNLDITPGNIIHKPSGTKCQHLSGNKEGEYSCLIHDREWYKQTPCFDHTQIEEKITDECRMGRFVIDNGGQVPLIGRLLEINTHINQL